MQIVCVEFMNELQFFSAIKDRYILITYANLKVEPISGQSSGVFLISSESRWFLFFIILQTKEGHSIVFLVVVSSTMAHPTISDCLSFSFFLVCFIKTDECPPFLLYNNVQLIREKITTHIFFSLVFENLIQFHPLAVGKLFFAI